MNIIPAHTQALLRAAWEKNTLYLPGSVPPEVVGVDIKQVPPALTSGELSDHTFYKDGKILNGITPVEGVKAYEEDGATIIIRLIDKLWPVLREIGKDVLPKFHSVSLVMSKGGKVGTPRHMDMCHVMALQMEGQKLWEVNGAGNYTLKPGDILYTPIKVLHRVTAVTDCWHLSFKYDERIRI